MRREKENLHVLGRDFRDKGFQTLDLRQDHVTLCISKSRNNPFPINREEFL